MEDGPLERFRLDIAYDGTEFRGWARQPGLRTVQGTIEDGLTRVFQRQAPVASLVVAGRTDSGVHAYGQVAHVDLTKAQTAVLRRRNPGDSPAATLQRRLRGVLSADPDVVISAVTAAHPHFDARFSALWRRYSYRIADPLAVRDPLQRLRTTWRPSVLDVEAMNAAAAQMIGLRDFAAYCKPRVGATTIRTLQDFQWHRLDDGVIEARLQADAFCHSMVRALVGASVAVGEGKLTAARMVELLDEKARSSEFVVQPARGLTLVEVVYPEPGLLGGRAEETRRRRSEDPAPV
jgi:tRNA pseudouridine38-40 synthase